MYRPSAVEFELNNSVSYIKRQSLIPSLYHIISLPIARQLFVVLSPYGVLPLGVLSLNFEVGGRNLKSCEMPSYYIYSASTIHSELPTISINGKVG